ncbi:MAG: hypothetical protein ACE366_04435 [Bradymonadia bacterium]
MSLIRTRCHHILLWAGLLIGICGLFTVSTAHARKSTTQKRSSKKVSASRKPSARKASAPKVRARTVKRRKASNSRPKVTRKPKVRRKPKVARKTAVQRKPAQREVAVKRRRARRKPRQRTAVRVKPESQTRAIADGPRERVRQGAGGEKWWTGESQRRSQRRWWDTRRRIRTIVGEGEQSQGITRSDEPFTWVDVEPSSSDSVPFGFEESPNPYMGSVDSLSDSGLSDSGLTDPGPTELAGVPGGTGVPSETTSVVEEGISEESPLGESSPWQVTVDTSLTWWRFDPVSTRPDDATWVNVTTEEIYNIDAVQLLHVGGQVRGPWGSLALAYETDQTLGALDPSILVDAALTLTGLEDVTFKLTTLDFQSGQVRLIDRNSRETLQRADFSVQMTQAEVRWHPLDFLFMFARYSSYAMPRNVYLQENRGTDEDPIISYHQISDQLVRVKTGAGSLGFGYDFDLEFNDDNRFRLQGLMGLGFGPYDLTTIYSDERLDDGWLAEIRLGVGADYRHRVTGPLWMGVQGASTMMVLSPLGLPSDVRGELRAAGFDTNDFSLTFGTVEFLSQLQIYGTLTF